MHKTLISTAYLLSAVFPSAGPAFANEVCACTLVCVNVLRVFEWRNSGEDSMQDHS